ncbi:MAG: hypothetical protein H0T42_32765 [Deltaproteobacteria bacterium]|nr:hypothetical protein [Deltaproteobacteria bacterium]
MATVQRSMWSKLGKYISAVVIACFFLPFFGISCDGMDVITISGTDMVGGCKPGGLITAADEEGKMQGGSIEAKIDDVDVEPFAVAALALVVIMFSLSFLGTRSAMRATLIVAVLASGALAALYVEMRGEMIEAVEKEATSMEKGPMTRDAKVSAGGRFGLWIAGLGLLSVIGLTASALLSKQRAAPEVTPPPEPIPPVV